MVELRGADVGIVHVAKLVTLVQRPILVVHCVTQLSQGRAVRRFFRTTVDAGRDAIGEAGNAGRAVRFVAKLVALVRAAVAACRFSLVTQLAQDSTLHDSNVRGGSARFPRPCSPVRRSARPRGRCFIVIPAAARNCNQARHNDEAKTDGEPYAHARQANLRERTPGCDKWSHSGYARCFR